VETGERMQGVGARLLSYSAGSAIFCQVLPTGQVSTVEVGTVEIGGRVQGVTG